ncbi:acyl-CoA thioesterase [Simiduia sp. 21SJ11W-1]|uniref:acyl-CoA thioesterase n=1 Tax=Simiduia sp. 21SJ11W-1 TaxID=2909669 RepID=UPI0020A007F8|nr:thioesterase family protein [Simiduia sp. 21SJ11W-1]UTA47630.1 acyl-CoA thioesterase [Simiduia sp. 21SJ11W-1]
MSGCEPFDFPSPYVQQITPQQADIDGLGHVNNAVYVQWCEQVAWAHSAALGLSLADYVALNRAMAIRNAHYDYLLPAQAGDGLRLATWLTASDARLNMTRQFQLLRGDTTLMRGRWQLVCIEMSSGRARRMPQAFLETYQPALVDAGSQGGGSHE